MTSKIARLCLLMLASFVVGWLLRPLHPNVQPLELADALPPWSDEPCVPAQANEASRYEIAVQALDIAGTDVNALLIGAQQLLAQGVYKRDGQHTAVVCPPSGLYHRVGEIMAKNGSWHFGRAVEHDLQLAWRIGEARPEIIQSVAAVAFNQYAQGSEYSSTTDIRPMARAVLASFGRKVATFGDVAAPLISSKDSLGTGAAQVAAAAGRPDALPKIAGLMFELLSSVPQDKAIPWDKRNRLYELAYAIAVSGDAGRENLQPVLQLMKRKVQSFAPPFGMIELWPKRMCGLLSQISHDDAKLVAQYPYCLSDEQPYEH